MRFYWEGMGRFGSVKKVTMIDLNKKMDVATACREIVKNCLQQLQDNTVGFLDGEEDCEYLRQMRVGIRRMRSAFSVFSHAFGNTIFSDIIRELRWLSGELGPARNWDVFVLEMLPPVVNALSSKYDFTKLMQASEILRRKNRERAVTATESQRFKVLLLKLGAVLSSDTWPQKDASPVGDFADLILEKCYRNFEKSGRRVTTLDAKKLHALRIDGKKLRYAAEFFSPLYSARAVRAFLSAMSGLQDALGAVNDAATTNHLLEELPNVDPGAFCLVKGWMACESVQRISRLGPQWVKFNTIDPFWN